MTSQEKIAFMHHFFGVDEGGHKCKECMHFERWQVGNKNVRKCNVYGLSNSEATDWNASFPACGTFDKDTPYSSLYKTRNWSRLTISVPRGNGKTESEYQFTLEDMI